MKKIAVLIDGGFLTKKLQRIANPHDFAEKIVEVATACVDTDEEELYRIFYYDCEAYGEKVEDLAGNVVDFGAKPKFAYQRSLLAYLAKRSYVAVRKGELSYRGWKLERTAIDAVKANPAHTISIRDFIPDFQQKGVDMRIGLDVALLAIDGLVDRVALVTADSDFIPAMKLARREGIQVVLVSLGSVTKPALLDHADIYRNPKVDGLRPPRRKKKNNPPVAAAVGQPAGAPIII